MIKYYSLRTPTRTYGKTRVCVHTRKSFRFAGDLCGTGGGTRTHTRLPSPDFESDKDCGMARDAALRGAFMSLFAFLCGIERVLVRPDSPKVSPKTSRRNLVGYRRAQTDTCTGISAAVDGP